MASRSKKKRTRHKRRRGNLKYRVIECHVAYDSNNCHVSNYIFLDNVVFLITYK